MPNYNEIKEKLEQRKKELTMRLNDPTNVRLLAESTGELSLVDQHAADHATQLYDREKEWTWRERDERELKEIEHALQKMEAGTYGICEKTNEKIPYARLLAQPTARTIIR